MDLKTVFSSISEKVTGETKPEEKLLAVKISSKEVSAASWKVVANKVELGPVTEAAVTDDLSKAVDQATSSTPDANKVIFGLPFHWVKDGKIIEEKLSLLRKVCTSLDLKPLGYVLLSEALENYYKEVEGAPLTAILLEFDGNDGLLTMYRAGKNLGTIPFNATLENVDTELEKALKSFTGAEVLPSRIIIYDGKDRLEKLAAKITAFPWTKSLPFLHFPKVEAFESGNVVRAIAVAGGMQMGGHFTLEEETAVPETPVTPEPLPAEEVAAELEEVEASEAGFFPETPSFGHFQEMAPSESPEGAGPEPKLPKLAAVNLAVLTQPVKNLGQIIGQKLPILLAAFRKIRVPKSKFVPLGVIAAIVLFLLFALVVYAVPKADILIKVSSPAFDKELAVTVVTEKSTRPATDSAKALNGTFLNVSEMGTKKGVTTGRKLVGDRAKGTITIYSTSDSHTFPAGTALTSPSGLKFSLDNSVTVASGSGAASQVTTTATVTAADIGDKYNLPAGALFSIGGFSSSSYQAKNDTAFTGGNSHEANVVAKIDQDRLIATLSAELADKANSDLLTKLGPGQQLLPNAVSQTVSQKKFSKDVDAEADTVSLDMTIDFSGVIFSQTDLISLFSQNFGSDIPSGFYLEAGRANVEIKSAKTDKFGNATIVAHVTSGLLPKIDSHEVISRVAGKSLGNAEKYLTQIPGVTGVSVDVQPKILSFLTKFFLPFKKDHLQVEIVSD